MKISIKRYAKYIFVLLVTMLLIFFMIANFALYPVKYKNEVDKYSSEYNVKKALVFGVIKTESSFKTNAISTKGAMGLMQIMPTTAKWLAEKLNLDHSDQKLLQSDYNINLGTYYLSYLQNKFNSLDNAILAYNAGEGTVSAWLANKKYSEDGKIVNNIPFKETANYLKKVKHATFVYENKL